MVKSGKDERGLGTRLACRELVVGSTSWLAGCLSVVGIEVWDRDTGLCDGYLPVRAMPWKILVVRNRRKRVESIWSD